MSKARIADYRGEDHCYFEIGEAQRANLSIDKVGEFFVVRRLDPEQISSFTGQMEDLRYVLHGE